MHRDRTSVVHACLVRYFHIDFIHTKFDIAFLIFMVMSLLKLSSLSSVPPWYLTLGAICIISLLVVNVVVDIFQSLALEPNVMYSVLLVFSLSLIVSIQHFITARMCSSFLCVLFGFFVSSSQKLEMTFLGSDHLQIHLQLCLLA